MKNILFILFNMFFLIGKAQISYSGFVGKNPIQLVTRNYSDGVTRAIYAYDKYDTPININGKLNGNILDLYERDLQDNITAILHFQNYHEESLTVQGTWISSDSSKKFPITLKKNFDVDKDPDFKEREIIQQTSMEKLYFKLLITKTDGIKRVSGVKVLEKKTDRLIQKIDLDCQLMSLDNISTGDFNFDGLTDFSVFESSYAGPNTSSIYILRIPNSEQYFVSDFSGTSLQFDEEAKIIYEHNQCCAGKSHMNASYKVVNNKMVLIEKKCLEYNEETEDFVEEACE